MSKEELKKEAQEQVNYCTPLYPECFIQGYVAGAEPRENKIADIKANCELAIEGRDVKIKELEQENAELKETLKTYNGCGDWDNDFHTCRVYLQHEELQMYINQLTKATDLLKKFIETSNPIYFDEDRQKVKVDAEQFIKEIEK